VEGSKGVDWVGMVSGVGRESRRRRVAPRLNDQIVLGISVCEAIRSNIAEAVHRTGRIEETQSLG
jgi:hypothetical protein